MGIVSFAGRVTRPAPQPLPVRIGGFGGTKGLINFIETQQISHVIDATHPFATQISAHAVAACKVAKISIFALTRPPWTESPEDHWRYVSHIENLKMTFNGTTQRIFLAIGRRHLSKITVSQHHFYLLRFVDPPNEPIPFQNYEVIVDRGPFTVEKEMQLLHKFRINFVVARNSGGSGAKAKILAARKLRLPVIMIERPSTGHQRQTYNPEDILNWLTHNTTARGV